MTVECSMCNSTGLSSGDVYQFSQNAYLCDECVQTLNEEVLVEQ